MKAEEYLERGIQHYGNGDFDSAITDLGKEVVVVTLLVHSCMVIIWEEVLSICYHISCGLDKEATKWNGCEEAGSSKQP